jgi:phosphoglycerate dehydrogenase-like enzyme
LKKEDVEKNNFCYYINNKKNLFENSSIISFHIPLLKSTKNFL